MNNQTRRFWILGALALLFVGVVALGVYQVRADFALTPTRLSDPNEPCNAVLPQADADAQGEWLGIAWVQGSQDNAPGSPCKDAGSAKLRWSTGTSARNGWSGIVTIAAGSYAGNSCVTHVDVEVVRTDASSAVAHVVVAERIPCGDPTSSQIRYLTYSLPDGVLSAPEKAYVSPGTTEIIRDVQLAVSDAGEPMVAYGVADITGVNGAIYYLARQGTWNAPLRQSSASNQAYRPKIAWSSHFGIAHMVWETHTGTATDLDGAVRYSNCTPDGTCEGPAAVAFSAETHPNPDISTWSNEAIVSWNQCDPIILDPPCERFHYVYKRAWAGSPAGFTFWESLHTKEVGTELIAGSVPLTRYYSTDDEQVQYKSLLRPSLVMDSEGMPFAAWQTEVFTQGVSAGYAITTTQAISLSENGYYDWEWNDTWFSQDVGYDLVEPSITLPVWGGDNRGLHIAYMKEVGLNKYEIWYDYFGYQRETPPTPTVHPCAANEGLCFAYLPIVNRR